MAVKAEEPNLNLADPLMEYGKQCAKALTKAVKLRIKFWYWLFRSMGCAAADSLGMARHTVQDEFNECDFTVNFDGPMAT